MSEIFVPYIETLKLIYQQQQSKYTLDCSPYESSYNYESALDYKGSNDIRYSSIGQTNQNTKIYYSICFEKQIKIVNYTFTEPNYPAGEYYCHQKSWNFYGSKRKENKQWIQIDQQINAFEHNQANYKGIYKVSNEGPFQCFKIEALESFYYYPMLTFRRFDIIAKLTIDRMPTFHNHNIHLTILVDIFILFTK